MYWAERTEPKRRRYYSMAASRRDVPFLRPTSPTLSWRPRIPPVFIIVRKFCVVDASRQIWCRFHLRRWGNRHNEKARTTRLTLPKANKSVIQHLNYEKTSVMSPVQIRHCCTCAQSATSISLFILRLVLCAAKSWGTVSYCIPARASVSSPHGSISKESTLPLARILRTTGVRSPTLRSMRTFP